MAGAWREKGGKMMGQPNTGNDWGKLRAFELRELVQSRLCRIATGDERTLRFEYDASVPTILVGREKELGELLTIVIGYSWDRLDRGGLDVAVQGFNERETAIKVQFSFCENRNTRGEDDSLYQQRSFRNAEDDGSEFRMMDEICSRLGIEMVTLFGPNGERYLAFVMQFAKPSSIAQMGQGTFFTDCLKGKRLLLVEDNELYREVLKGHLVQWGVEVEEACNAEAAIEAIDRSSSFDFGVFDISLPGMSGRDLAQYCRSSPFQSDMKIISLSGVQRPCVDDLFDEGLVKPTMPDVLKELLTRYASGLS